MRKFLLLLVIISLGLAAHGQKPLSDKAEISLMTSAPYEAEVFTVYVMVSFPSISPTSSTASPKEKPITNLA